ncbi:hypothetical protein [Sphingobacterium kitahiroshimense]|uniref:hypothetical protein n=1 Tax=Sphingobacterium kitahiroshimense TaxID=470446 RepID=UPI00320B0B01
MAILFSEANIQNLSPNRRYNTDDCPSCNRSFSMIRSIVFNRRQLDIILLKIALQERLIDGW